MDPLSAIFSGASAVANIFGGMREQDNADRNFDLASENLDWQKSMQQESWRRDDTAVQRRAADMSAAGINPLMAAGSAAGNAPVVHTEAPQIDTRAASAGARGISEGAQKGIAALSMAKDFAVKDAQAQLLQAQAHNVEVDTDLKGAQASGKLMENDVYRINNAMDISTMRSLGNALLELANSDQVKYAKDKVGAQQALQSGRRAEAEAMQELVSAGVDKQKAEALASRYGADIAKNHLTVSDATLPATVAGAYADVAGKAVGVGSNLTFGVWLKNFLNKSGGKLDKMSKFVDKYE